MKPLVQLRYIVPAYYFQIRARIHHLRQYAVGDFAARQAGIALKKSADDIAKYTNRSMNFVNHWDSSLTHDGFTGFLQRRYPV